MALRATAPAVRARREAYVEAVLRDFLVLPFGLAEAREHAHLGGVGRARHADRTSRPTCRATALVNGSAVATLNQKEFKRVPGLALAMAVSGFTQER